MCMYMCIYVHACMDTHIFPILVHFIFSRNICFLYIEICMIGFLNFYIHINILLTNQHIV